MTYLTMTCTILRRSGPRRVAVAGVAVAAAAVLAACGSNPGGHSTTPGTGTAGAAATAVAFNDADVTS